MMAVLSCDVTAQCGGMSQWPAVATASINAGNLRIVSVTNCEFAELRPVADVTIQDCMMLRFNGVLLLALPLALLLLSPRASAQTKIEVTCVIF
jgi:hypothetical protein